MEFKKEGYYYLHTNGNIIYKPPAVMIGTTESDYFDSPFVVRYWYIITEEAYEKMIDDIKDLGVDL